LGYQSPPSAVCGDPGCISIITQQRSVGLRAPMFFWELLWEMYIRTNHSSESHRSLPSLLESSGNSGVGPARGDRGGRLPKIRQGAPSPLRSLVPSPPRHCPQTGGNNGSARLGFPVREPNVTEPGLDRLTEEPSGTQRSWRTGSLFNAGGLRGEWSPKV